MRDILTIILIIVGAIAGAWLLSKYSIGLAVVGGIAGAIVGFIIGKFFDLSDILTFWP